MSTRALERATLEIAGFPLDVVAAVGTEAVSRFFRVELTCEVAMPDVDPSLLLAKDARLVLRSGDGPERTLTGTISEVATRSGDDGTTGLSLILSPKHHTATLGRDCRAFHDKDSVTIAEDVLSKHGPVRRAIVRTYRKRSYTVQYREDDLGFALRLLEEDGVYFWFDHEQGSVLVLEDHSTASPELEGGAPLWYSPESGMNSGTSETVTELGREVCVTPNRSTVRSFDPERPSLRLEGQKGSGAREWYEAHGGGLRTPADCQVRSDDRVEAWAAQADRIVGKTTSVRVYPGRIARVDGGPDGISPRCLLLRSSWAIRQREAIDSMEAYACSFTGIAANVPYRPDADSAVPKVAGLQSGAVVGAPGEEIHVDGAARVRVVPHWDRSDQNRGPNAGWWMRVAQRGTAQSMLFPRVGWNVMTFNEEGSLDAPSVLSRVFDAEHPPPYPLPENKTRVVFKTATTPGGGSFNEIHFEDKKGAEVMFVNASRDMNVFTKNRKDDIVNNDHSKTIGVDHTMTVAQNYRETVEANQTVTIAANETFAAEKSRTKTVGGDEAVTIGGARNIKTGGQHTTSVKLARKLSVGPAIIDVSLGQISADAHQAFHVLVGGAVVRLAKSGLQEECGKIGVQTIGAARVEIAGEQRTLDVRKVLFETVAGALVIRADKQFLDTADQKFSMKVGATLTAKAPDVWVEAQDEIVVKCGATSIKVTKDKIELQTPKLDLTGATGIEHKTAVVEHN